METHSLDYHVRCHRLPKKNLPDTGEGLQLQEDAGSGREAALSGEGLPPAPLALAPGDLYQGRCHLVHRNLKCAFVVKPLLGPRLTCEGSFCRLCHPCVLTLCGLTLCPNPNRLLTTM